MVFAMKVILKIILMILALSNSSKAGSENNTLLTDILLINDGNSTSGDLIFEDAINVGYNVAVVVPDSVTLDLVNRHRLVILSTGNNPAPITNNNMRTILIGFVDNGGKMIIEGGQNGYVAAVIPYPAFLNKVLNVLNWTADNGGNLLISGNFMQSPLALVPTVLPHNIQINFTSNYDQDVCTIGAFSDIFYKTSSYEDNAGIIVSPGVLEPQLINYCFNYSSVAVRTDAKRLLTNSIYNLIGESVGINNTGQGVPSEYRLYQNYPNPFNPNTVIGYQITLSSYAEIKIYNVLGNLIETLVNEKQPAGSYEVDWNGSNFSSGIYFYTLSIDGVFFGSKKMFLLK